MNEALNTDAGAEASNRPRDGESLSPVVAAILGTALTAAAKRGGSGDVVRGLIAGLRILRATVEEEAGYTMAAAVDNAIRTRLLADNLSRLRVSGQTPQAVPLPGPGPGSSAAAAIFESAAESCLTVNAHAEDNGPLEHAVFAFTAQLLQQLGGAPEWRSLAGELRRPLAVAPSGEEDEVTLH
ncbi:hypothetical protein VY88_03740 [Azospirillum thiophilum]|uniref:Uncharacterized protein n=1 Tax=Azospirillum thiophilum TaxID=528244 RepID=A0AAC8ZTN1_9PROT|nr:hypothetical protein [Azospirillum thiophilum]ALG71020.1 hypothetical protein AL072_08960 [Azospirillum thiophilum]KJR65317.1 hypothetical protein VY88_03740 [Azospirillum thiophilum]